MDQVPIFFSVIVLAYHVEPYLRNCLDSVIRQNFKNFEILIVNPQPNDRTEEVIREYTEKYSQIQAVNVKNRGQLLNRTAGFSRAKGKYLLCLDGDDWWSGNLLDTVYRTLQKQQADLIIFGHQKVKKDQVVRKVIHTFSDGEVFEGKQKKAVYEKFVQGGPINEMWTRVISRELFLRIKKDFSDFESMRKGEDLLYNLYLADEAERIIYIDAPLYYYRQREGSVMRTFRPEELEDTLIMKEHIREMMKKWNMEGPKYIDMFYHSAAVFFMDYIYRCCVSNLSGSRKKEIMRRIRNEPYYKESCRYQKKERVHTRHWIFVKLFHINDVLPVLYGNLYRMGKKAAKIKKVLGDEQNAGR